MKSNPDSPQLPARRRARRDGKTLYMAVPRLAEAKPFVRVGGDPTIRKALAEGHPARVEDLGHVDLVVCGTVAVNRAGVRVGKGGGYSDLELGLLVEAGAVDDATTAQQRQRGQGSTRGSRPELGRRRPSSLADLGARTRCSSRPDAALGAGACLLPARADTPLGRGS